MDEARRFDTLGLESVFAERLDEDEGGGWQARLSLGEETFIDEHFAMPGENPAGEWLGEMISGAESAAAEASAAEWLETEWLDTSGETSAGETVEAFCERLGREWSQRLKGERTPEVMRDGLLRDHEDTLAGARLRWTGNRATPALWERVSRAWMVSREQAMQFKTEPGVGVAPLRIAPPAARVDLVADSLVGGSVDTVRKGKAVPGARIAPFTLRFARALRGRHGSVGMTNYHGHGGGSFNNRGYSLDLWLSGTDARGFYRHDEAVRLLRAVDAAARAVGAQWRVIYNDFAVADAINRELRRRHVIFMGEVRRNKAKQVTGINWHGPDPLILHFHLDITQLSGADQGEVDHDEAFTGEAGNEVLGSDEFSGEWPGETFEEFRAEESEGETRRSDLPETGFEDEGERWTDDKARYFEHELSDTDRSLQAGDWRGAVTAAIKAGERDEAKLTNLVFFFRHPDLDRTQPLQPKRSKADAALAAKWSKIGRCEVWPAIVDFAKDPVLAVDGKQIAGRITHFRGQAGKRFKQLVAAAAQKVGLNPGVIAAALIGETGTTADYLTPEKVWSYRIGVDDFYDLRNVLAKNVPAYADIRWNRNQTPIVHLNDAKTKQREVKTIWFDSGPDGLLATSVYLKYAEVRLRSDAKALGGDFDTLPVETRFALIRMSMAAGRAGATKRLARALKGEDILVRNWAPPKIYQTERNATIRAAEAMFLSGWVFGQPLTPQPPIRPQPEQFGADEGEGPAPWDKEDHEENEDENLAWLAFEGGNPAPLFEEEDEWAGEENESPEAEWTETESFEPALAEDFDSAGREETGYFHEAPYGYLGEGQSADIATLEALLEADIGAGEATDRLKGSAAFVLGPTLRRGNSGPAVESLQRALVRIGTPIPGTGGNAAIVTDGKFGPATERAVCQFQRTSGLTPDGVVGQATKTALAAALGGGGGGGGGGGAVTTSVSPFSTKLYPTEMAPDAGHNARLATALGNVRRTLTGKQPAMLDKAALIIVRLTPSGQMTFAGVREDEMFFSGSLLKIALLYASFELVERVNALAPHIPAASAADFFGKVGQAFDARIAAAVPQIRSGAWQKVAYSQALEAVPAGPGFTVKMARQHGADLERIFALPNENDAPSNCMHRLGFSYVNGNADAAGFFGVVSQKGIWMATDIVKDDPPGRNNWPSFNIPVVTGTSSTAMTALSMANLIAQFKRGQLINPFASRDMLRIFQRDGSWFSSLPKAARDAKSFTVMGAKVGHADSASANVPVVKSEAALLRRKADCAEFVTVWQNVPDALDFARIYDVIDEVIKTWP